MQERRPVLWSCCNATDAFKAFYQTQLQERRPSLQSGRVATDMSIFFYQTRLQERQPFLWSCCDATNILKVLIKHNCRNYDHLNSLMVSLLIHGKLSTQHNCRIDDLLDSLMVSLLIHGKLSTPIAGTTTFSTVWSCRHCSRSAQLALPKIKASHIMLLAIRVADPDLVGSLLI